MKRKAIISLILIVGLIFTGVSFNLLSVQASDKNPELTKLKQNLETNGLLYITENDFDSEKTIEFNKEQITTRISTLNPNNIDKLDADKFKNIVVEASVLNNKDILNKLKESYENGAKIIIRKDNIKKNEAYNLMGETKLELSQEVSSSDKLTPVAVSIFKDPSGQIYSAGMNVEINNENEVLRIIIIALRDDKNYFEFSKQENQGLIQSKQAVASIGSNPSWPYVDSDADYDSWTSVTVNYAINLKKNPYNPNNNKYYCIEYSPVTVTPNSGYYSGDVYLYHKSNSSGTINDFEPTTQTNVAAISATLGISPNLNLNFGIGNRTNITINSGGLGNSYIQWKFRPVSWLGGYQPTANQTCYEPTSEYYQNGSTFTHNLRYYVDMYTNDNPDFIWYGAAQYTNINASGS